MYQSALSFVQKDLDICSRAHQVRTVPFSGLRAVPTLWQATMWGDMTFSWFGKLHAFFAVLFSKVLGKKAIVEAGGDDVAYEPVINYGMFAYWWKKWCPLFVFRYADLILSVSEFNRGETIENARANPSKVKVICYGFDAQKWQRMGGAPKENLVLTVGRVSNETFRKKGLICSFKARRTCPTCHLYWSAPGRIARLSGSKRLPRPTSPSLEDSMAKTW